MLREGVNPSQTVDFLQSPDKKGSEKVMASRKRKVQLPPKPGTFKRSEYIKVARQVIAERVARTGGNSRQVEDANQSQTVDSKPSTDEDEEKIVQYAATK